MYVHELVPSYFRLGLPSHAKIELSVGNELLRKTDNHRYVMNASVPLRDKMVCITVVYTYVI